MQKQMTEDSELASLMEDGKDMAGGGKSPAEIIAALKDNDEFLINVKKLVCEYVREAVTQANIPTIDGTKSWGAYQIAEARTVHKNKSCSMP